MGVNAQSVQQVSTAFLGLLEAAGQAAGEVAGVLGAPRANSASTTPTPAAEEEHHRMQRRRVLRWGIGLVVLLGGYHALRGVAGSSHAHPRAARKRLTWMQVMLHLLALLASAGVGYGLGPRALLQGAMSSYTALKAVAKGEDPLAPPALEDDEAPAAAAAGGGSSPPAEAAGSSAHSVPSTPHAQSQPSSSPLRRAVMSPEDARSILQRAIAADSDDEHEAHEGGGAQGVEGGVPAVVEASPMVGGGHNASERKGSSSTQRALQFKE